MNFDCKEFHSQAAAAVRQQVESGAALYVRSRHLRRLLPLAPEDFSQDNLPATRAIVLRLANAMRQERRLGRMGHWTYDLNRHIALAQAYRAEKQFLEALKVSQQNAC